LKKPQIKIVELKVRIPTAEDILGVQIQEMQKKTALLQVIDPITKQHTATLKQEDFAKFYTVVMNFANNASMGSASVKQVSAMNEKSDEKQEVQSEAESCEVDGYINGMTRADQCNKCGKYGHWARDCKGKGKGKGKGDSGGAQKGKGKGKGPTGGCWICRGDHYRDQCPQGSKGDKGGKSFGSKGGAKGFWGGKGKGGINIISESDYWNSWDGGAGEAFRYSLKSCEGSQEGIMGDDRSEESIPGVAGGVPR